MLQKIIQNTRQSLDANKIDRLMYVMIMILALSSCISEIFCRHIIRALILLMLVRLWLNLSPLGRIKESKMALVATFLLMGMFFVEAIYGGNFWITLSKNEFRLHYYMLVAPIVIMCLKEQRQVYQVIALLAVSILVADLYIYWSTWHGALRPAVWGHGAVMITSMLYLMIIPALVVLVFHPALGVLQKLFYLIASAMSAVALVCTATRGAWIAIAFTFIPLVLYHIHNLKRAFMVFGIVAIFLGSIIGTNSYYTMNATSIGDMRDVSQAERLLLWKSCLFMFYDHPFMGVGLGNFKQEYDEVYMEKGMESFSGDLEHHIRVLRHWKQPDHAHSNYFQFLGETGLFGFSVYVVFSICVLCWSWKHRDNVFSRIFFFSTVALLLYSATDYTLAGFAAMRVYWLLLGLAGSSVHIDAIYKRNRLR